MLERHALLVCWVLVGAPSCGSSGASGGASACEFVVLENRPSSEIPTVGVVEWSLSGEPPSSAKVVYWLDDAEASVLNRGGEAPVDLDEPGFRTLLLGLKQGADYSFRIQATRSGQTCSSEKYRLPTTGSLVAAPSVEVELLQPDVREPGFIVTSSGTSLPPSAFIVDADGDVVWYSEGPSDTTRAQMDYEGKNMWMVALNLLNLGGEMRRVSMDGEQEERDVAGLASAHHDFTVMPGGRIAALSWRAEGIDPESELLIRSPNGEVTPAFSIGENLYQASAYHANAIHYVPFDGGFTISDRNPNVFVKVTRVGALEWQLGGQCEGAPAADDCAEQDWEINHGHHLLEDGTFVLFNNGSGNAAHVLEFAIEPGQDGLSATLVEDYVGEFWSTNLGDVQRLPAGNTLVTYSSDGKILELDQDWDVVQIFTVRVGYASWRPTLYGAPVRP